MEEHVPSSAFLTGEPKAAWENGTDMSAKNGTDYNKTSQVLILLVFVDFSYILILPFVPKIQSLSQQDEYKMPYDRELISRIVFSFVGYGQSEYIDSLSGMRRPK